MKKAFRKAKVKKGGAPNGLVDKDNHVLDEFLLSSKSVNPANRLPRIDPDSWVPEAMQLAQLAATLFPTQCKEGNFEDALASAWAVFLHSQTFCLQIRGASRDERVEKMDSILGGHVPPVVRYFVRKPTDASKVFRYDPRSAGADEVRNFFGVKKAETMEDIFRKYLEARKEPEDDAVAYKNFLSAAERTDADGNVSYEFPEPLLRDIQKQRGEAKSLGGRRSLKNYEAVHCEIIED